MPRKPSRARGPQGQDLGASKARRVYEQARRHGYGHERALESVEAGRVVCWCGCPTPCVGGAQRLFGCVFSITPEHPEGFYNVWKVA